MSGARYQRAIDRALGAVGRRLGQPYAVYRCIQTSNGHFPQGWHRQSQNVGVVRNRVTSRNIESAVLSERTIWFELAGDLSPFQLGDVFVNTDPQYYPGIAYGAGATHIPGTDEIDGFAFAAHAPMDAPVGARVDRLVGIYRPALKPVMAQDGSYRWSETHEADSPLILVNGRYVWGDPGAAASWVPCGFTTNDRNQRGGPFPPDQIGMTPVNGYTAYLPPLPGYVPTEGDAIITRTDERHVITAPYYSETGVVGAQMMIQRFISEGS